MVSSSNIKLNIKTAGEYFSQTDKINVMIIGDIMLDRTVTGHVDRISPEAPVPVLLADSITDTPGGAGNVAMNIHALGAKTYPVCIIGDDSYGEILLSRLSDCNCDISGIIKNKDRHTTLKTRYVSSGQQLLRVDNETVKELDSQTETSIIEKIRCGIKNADAIILSDYGKGVLTEKILEFVITEANKNNIPILTDPKKSDYGRYRNCDFVTPNRKELSEATDGMPAHTDEEILTAGSVMLKSSGIKSALITRSEDGMTLIQRKANAENEFIHTHIRTLNSAVYDVTGAGDTVIAVMAICIASGMDYESCAKISNIAGGIVVGKSGTATASVNEILSVIDRKSVNAFDNDYTASEENLNIVAEWKNQGNIIGFTNGCFDILHRGHVDYLKKAKSECDKLVLGLNGDLSVKRLKGENRPVNDEKARAEILKALSCVDLVIIFGNSPDENDKPIELIKKIKPDIHFKGGDYKAEELPEHDAVTSCGGKVKILSFTEGYSTTSTINKIMTK